MLLNYEKFKLALKRVEEERFEILKKDIEQVKIWVEKMLTLGLESTSSISRASYLGLDM